MQNLSTLLRNLADIIDANGGQVPEILMSNRTTSIKLSEKPKARKINSRQAYINERVHEVLFTPNNKKK